VWKAKSKTNLCLIEAHEMEHMQQRRGAKRETSQGSNVGPKELEKSKQKLLETNKKKRGNKANPVKRNAQMRDETVRVKSFSLLAAEHDIGRRRRSKTWLFQIVMSN
jgi:hypothetical protein